MTKTTYEAIYVFLLVSQVWLAAKEENAKSKLGYALQKVRLRAEKLWNQYQAKVEDLNIDHCVVDDKGVILKDEKGEYKFTKEGMKARNQARQKLYESEVEIDPHFVTAKLPELSTSEQLAFIGFVMREEIEEQAETETMSVGASSIN